MEEEKQSLITFPNKLRLVVSARDTRAVSVVVVINYGAENEPARESGISSVIERLISYDLAPQMARYGGMLTTRATLEHLEITVCTIRDNLDKILTAISRAIFDFNPKVEAFNNAKLRVIQKLENAKSAPISILERLTKNGRFGKIGLSNSLLGNITAVNNLTLEEVRNYFAKTIGPKNMTISVVGDIADKKETENDASKYDEVYALVIELFYGKLIKYRDTKPKFSEKYSLTKPVFMEKSKCLNQDRFELSFEAPSYSDNAYKYCKLLVTYLQSYIKNHAMGKNNIYSLDLESFAYRNNGYIGIQFAVDSLDAIEVYKSMISTLLNVKNQGVTIGEFEGLKKAYVSKVVFQHETALSYAKRYTKWIALKDTLFDLDKELKEIQELNYNSFKIAVQEILDFGKLCVSHVGRKRSNFDPFEIIKTKR